MPATTGFVIECELDATVENSGFEFSVRTKYWIQTL
jgi:hypothetical protein